MFGELENTWQNIGKVDRACDDGFVSIKIDTIRGSIKSNVKMLLYSYGMVNIFNNTVQCPVPVLDTPQFHKAFQSESLYTKQSSTYYPNISMLKDTVKSLTED